MIVEHSFFIGMSDINKQNKITEKRLLAMLEDTAGIHSDLAGYGILDIEKTKHTWMLLAWKLNFIRRPMYGETITIKTWAKPAQKIYVYRDFEVFDEENNLIAIAGSKWVYVDIENQSIARPDEEMLSKYEVEEEKSVTDNSELNKLKEPLEYSNVITYTINKEMIDINNHVHNLNYLDLAAKAVPEEVDIKEICNLDIMYRKEIKLDDTVKCLYSFDGEKHTVSIKSEDEKDLHAILVIK